MPLNLMTAPVQTYNRNFRVIPQGNLAIWLDGDQGVATTGGVVTSWTSRVGGIVFSQGTAGQQPGYSASGSNGHGQLTFDGTNDWLLGDNAAKAVTNNIAGFTLYMVVQAANLGANQQIFNATTPGALARCAFTKIATTNYDQLGGRRLDADSAQTANTSSAMGTDKVVSCLIWDWANTDAYVYRNGSAIASNTSFQTAGNTSASNSSNVLIGAAGAGVLPLSGVIAEVMCYTAAHTNAALRSAVTAYLGEKHGVAVS